MVVDEAHVIKTPNAQKTIAMKNIRAGCYFALTGKWPRLVSYQIIQMNMTERCNAGTLIQNRYSEMWSVLDFVSPGSFGTHGQWDETIGRPLKAGLDYNASVKQLAQKQVRR